jgi:5-formyltetrahydrofolate cyclo-ligase
MTDAPDDPKPALRRLFRAERAAFVAGLPPGGRERLERDLASMVTPLLVGHRHAASYAAVGAEIDPNHVEKRLPGHAFPLVTGRDLSFHVADWADLKPGVLGIPEPDASAPQVTPDLLLVPLLAVTPAGVRLGQGGGYYDRALAALRATGRLTAIGLAWDVQIADALPRDPWDELLDWVATPTRLVDCAKHR